MNDLLEDFDGQLAVVFKHFPLGKTCNPLLQVDLHPQACSAARAAEAARSQGKFWPFHDAIFAAVLNETEEALEWAAKTCRLDMAQFNLDRTSDVTRIKVQSDITLGNRLGVHATPTVFLNGRRVAPKRLAALGSLIHHELAPYR